MKLKSYNILFRLFSFLSDKTNGAPFFVKYKLLLGTLLIGMAGGTSTKASEEKIAYDTISVQQEVSTEDITAIPPKSTQNTSNFIEIEGNVRDEQGPLPSADIEVKGTARGTSTDIYGNFSIKAKIDDTLVFSFMGYPTKEVRVSKIKDGKVVIILKEENYSPLILERRASFCYAPVRRNDDE